MTDTLQSISTNPLLMGLKLPGRTFVLPSRGLFYTNGELADTVQNGEIHIHPISALAEIVLKNPDMLFSGQAIEKVFKECIPDIRKPHELFGKDVDAIMCYLRMVTYGPSYDVTATHNCRDAKSHSYIIDLEKIVSESIPLDPTLMDAQYKVTLDNNQVVELEPIRFKHVIQLLQTVDREGRKFTAEEIQNGMIANTLNTIRSVGGIEDKAMIESWLRAIPSTYMNRIAELIESSNAWGLNYVRKVRCKDCGEHFNLEIPVNPVSFFSE